jgi:peptidoglycan/xylan/chitin deacetylase (PgdA/CDA1 family)
MTKKFEKREIIDRLSNKIHNILSIYLYKKRRLLIKGQNIVTFTFDDCHETSISYASKLLDKYNKYGTFYMSLSLNGKKNANGKYADTEQIASILKKGHELACHTYSHLDCCANAIEHIKIDCKNNRDTSRHLFGVDMNSFSYPYGSMCPSVKKMLGKEYATLRTVSPGINRNCIDLAALKSVPIYGSVENNECVKWLNAINNTSGWLIFYTHDVMTNHSMYGCTEDLIHKLIIESMNNNIQILSIRDVINEFVVE